MGFLDNMRTRRAGRPLKTTNVTTQTPPPYAQPYLEDVLTGAKNLNVNQPTVAPFSGTTQAGLSAMEGIAGAPDPLAAPATAAYTGGIGAGQAGTDGLLATARGDYLGQNNQFLNGMYQRGADDILARTKSAYSGMGRYGSGPMDRAIGDSTGNLFSSIYAPAYESERNRMTGAQGQLTGNALNWASQTPTINNQRYAGATGLLTAGGIRDEQANAETMDPWNRLQNYSNAVSASTVGGTTTEAKPRTPWLNALKIGGKVLSTAIGMFSDVRVKEDIKPVGKTDGGSTVYTYRYKGDDPTVHMGVMAQEQLKKNPEAVGQHRGTGLLMVDYSRVR